jgi:hypothetical protein
MLPVDRSHWGNGLGLRDQAIGGGMPGGLGGVMNGTSGAGSGEGCSGPGGGTISGPGAGGGMMSGVGRSGPGIGAGCGVCGGTSGGWAADMVDIGSRLFRLCLAEASGGACGSRRNGGAPTRVAEEGIETSPRPLGGGIGEAGAGSFLTGFALPQPAAPPSPQPPPARGGGDSLI